MTLYPKVEAFLEVFCSKSSPVLLALSGGPDSLCLFYCLLAYRKFHLLPFHVVHVNHRWRPESFEESQVLKRLAAEHHVPFYLKDLKPEQIKGNLEAACREERYAFFKVLYEKNNFQGVLTGHHEDDQAETICKRILEGAHWSKWSGLKPESTWNGCRILRPLLSVSKQEIKKFLIQHDKIAFEDPTNFEEKFLRARLRKSIFPWLNREFGKRVENSFLSIGEEAQELVEYFEKKMIPILNHVKRGPWGTFIDLQLNLPENLLEIKYLLRSLCAHSKFFLSREILEQASKVLLNYEFPVRFEMGVNQIFIDRRRLFIIKSQFGNVCFRGPEIKEGGFSWGEWKITVTDELFSGNQPMTSWRDGWEGKLITYLPKGKIYRLNSPKSKDLELAQMKKRWKQAKIPVILCDYFPVIDDGKEIVHEFLTGLPLKPLVEQSSCWKIELFYELND